MDASRLKILWPFVGPLLLALGFISAVQHIYQTFSVLLQTFIIPGISVSTVFFTGHFLNLHLDQLERFGARKGAWAVVTGATDGIGKEFSYQLAKNGFNVLLVARNSQLLSEIAVDIGQSYMLCIPPIDLRQLG
jgi:17beta-estradiol 17-dehydrogenase / very-long-chain 3-oxoacyl-CoA reductase